MPERLSEKEKKTLVTGAGGFIGSHVVEQLLEMDYAVVCLLKYGENPRWISNLPVKFIEGDLRDTDSLNRSVQNIPMVIHLAGRLGGWSDPSSIHEVNLNGTKNLFRAFREYGKNQRRFLFVSSLAAAGGTPSTGIYDETRPPAPFSAYGRSKLSCEKYLLKQDIPSTIVRLPIVYGPRSFRGLYPIFKIGAKGIELSMKKVSTVVGYVEDIARGIIQAAESPVTAGQIYYLGEDCVYSSADICSAISGIQNRRMMKIHLPYPVLYSAASLMEVFAKLRKKNPLLWRRNLTEYLNRHYRYSMKKARRDFGYKSHVPLNEGVGLTADWYRRHHHV